MDYDLVIIAGTRPEYLKLASVFAELKKTDLNWCFVNTGQHKDLMAQVQSEAWPQINLIREQSDLDLSVAEVINNLSEQFKTFLKSNKIKKLMIQGDTLSAFAGAQWGFMNKIPVWHLEAGMRTHDLKDPFPEEGFRRAISTLTSLHLCPNENAKKNLVAEGFDASKIQVVGNTLKDLFLNDVVLDVNRARTVLVTIHRHRDDDDVIFDLGVSLKKWSVQNDYKVIWLNHPNKRLLSWVALCDEDFVECKPMSHSELKRVLLSVSKVVTDSGGLQEEARWLGCPVSILRESTEWSEGVARGESVLVGARGEMLVEDLSNKNRIPWDPVLDSKSAAKKVVEFLVC